MNEITINVSEGLDFPDDLQSSIPKKISKLIELECKNNETYSLELSILSNDEMLILNKSSRNKNYSTDVLSFPAENIPGSPIQNLGNLYIAWEVCKKQAEEIGHSNVDEFDRLLVHGFLHLLGYDHEISKEEEIKMMKKEDECLRGLEF
jgi:probable rRNA maturation factor